MSVTSQQVTSYEKYRILGVDHLTVLGDPNTGTKIQEWLEKPWQDYLWKYEEKIPYNEQRR